VRSNAASAVRVVISITEDLRRLGRRDRRTLRSAKRLTTRCTTRRRARNKGESVMAWYWTRWFLFVPGVVAALISVGLIAGLICEAISVWDQPVVGAAGAAAFVFAGYVIAPEFKVHAAAFALLAGAAMAWQLLSPPSFYPETNGPDSYQPTYLPIMLTCSAGLLSWCACVVLKRCRGRAEPAR
jgi:hypothetical protein